MNSNTLDYEKEHTVVFLTGHSLGETAASRDRLSLSVEVPGKPDVIVAYEHKASQYDFVIHSINNTYWNRQDYVISHSLKHIYVRGRGAGHFQNSGWTHAERARAYKSEYLLG